MLYESLEPRRMLSTTLNSTTHVLTDIGTSGNDVIQMTVVNGVTLRVIDNGVTHSYPLAQVKKIVVNAGNGDDTVRLDAGVKVGATLYSGLSATTDGDSIIGGSGNDTIYLQDNYSVASGGAGNDTIYVQGGFSGVDGGAGNDRLVSKIEGGEDNHFSGGSGSDTLDYSQSSTVASLHSRNSAASRQLKPSGAGPTVGPGLLIRNSVASHYFVDADGTVEVYADSIDGFDGIENFIGTQYNDYIYGDGNANSINGSGGDDVINGGGGNDTLDGGAGKDALFGNAGNDTLISRDGAADFLSGGTGTDSAKKDSLDTAVGVEVVLP